MGPWHLSQKPKPEMGWDESYVSRLIFTRNQVDDQKEEVKLSSAIVRRFVTFPPQETLRCSRKTGCGHTFACWQQLNSSSLAYGYILSLQAPRTGSYQ